MQEHIHESKKSVQNRMARAIGHLNSVKKMIDENRDCSDILIQLSAVKAELNNLGKIILQDHLNHCIVDAIETGDKEMLASLNNAIAKML